MDHPLVKTPVRKNLRIQTFMSMMEEKYGLELENYWDFHKWTVESTTDFWGEAWKFLEIITSVPYENVLEPGRKFEDVPEWFTGARMNYAENALRHRDGVALILTGEEHSEAEYLTYGQLRDEVALLVAALRKSGVKPGDIIACYISNRKEAITSMLAAAAVGALFSATNPLMAGRAVVSRFHQVSLKVLFTIDRYPYNKEEKDVLSMLPGIVEELPSIELVVIVPSNEESKKKDISHILNSCFYTDYLTSGLDEDGKVPAPYYAQLAYSHPFIINFTSGTTGSPKGIVHSAGAVLLGPLKDLAFHYDTSPSDVMLTFYSPGWMSWNFFVCALTLGASLLVYEGVPFFRHPTAFWDLVDRYGVTMTFLVPSVLEEMQKRGFLPGEHNSLKTLHSIISGACHVKSHTFDFVYEHIKPDVMFTTGYGSTESMMMIAGINYILPVHKEELQAPSVGTSVCSYDEAGQEVFDAPGELIIKKPFPSMPLCFWKDEDKKKYRSAFFEKFPGVWSQGDVCVISSQTGGLVVLCRSDETIKQRGARFGSAEIYEIVNKQDAVADSLCVSYVTGNGDEIAALFIKVGKGYAYSSELVETIKKEINNELTFRHVPEVIAEVKEIPYNINGKRMEVLVKKILSKVKNIALDTAANSECLAEYQEFAKTL